MLAPENESLSFHFIVFSRFFHSCSGLLDLGLAAVHSGPSNSQGTEVCFLTEDTNPTTGGIKEDGKIGPQ